MSLCGNPVWDLSSLHSSVCSSLLSASCMCVSPKALFHGHCAYSLLITVDKHAHWPWVTLHCFVLQLQVTE